MWKAYLAHASEDKPFVQSVARELGRINVVYDEMCFKAGDNLEEAIKEGIEKSKLFVFFASKESLSRFWPSFEISEAKARKLRAFTVVVDTKVEIGQVPEWMRHWLVLSPAPSSVQTARMIKMRLIADSGLDKQMPFVGREKDLEDFSNKLITPQEQPNPRIIVISGLDGIGRRTFARRALRDYLSLEIGPIIPLEETDSLDKLQWYLLEETAERISRDEIAKALAEFKALSLDKQAEEIARRISLIGENSFTPTIIDSGALIDEYGKYSDQVLSILGALLKYKDTYLVLIHRRRPEIPSREEIKQGIVYYRLNPLKLENTELLLRQRMKNAGVKATSLQIRDLATFMEGYPPSVELACNYAREYGLATVLSDKSALVDLQVRAFSPIINRFNLDSVERTMLRVLASENPLPLEVLALILDRPEPELVPSLKHLIDLNLVVPVDINFGISPPVREAVRKIQGYLSEAEYKIIGEKVLAKYWGRTTDMPSLAIVDLTIHALARSNNQRLDNFSDLVLPSQLLRVAKEAYDSKDWDKAIEFSKRTLELDESRYSARVILCKAYVRKDNWDFAEMELETIRKQRLKKYFYCKGFLEWKRGNLPAAISAFKSAIRAGDTWVSVYRDLAHCQFRNGDVEDAIATLDGAPQGIFRNSYVVDLAAQISIARRDFGKAKGYIDTLEHIASPDIFHLRRSMYYVALGKLPAALADAESACSGAKPTFEAFCQKADVLIEMGDFTGAEKIVDELRPPNNVKHDVKIGLKCKLLLKQNRWEEAGTQFNYFHNKELPPSRMCRKEILQQKIADPRTKGEERESAIVELKKIGSLLNLPIIIDDEVSAED